MPVRYMNAAGRASLQLGRGVDTVTGSPLGVAIRQEAGTIDSNNSGQIVSYDVTIIETVEELNQSLGMSVGAEMRYGLFDTSGKFEMSEKAQYKSFATYVIAKCDVRNPPVGLFDPVAKEGVAQYVNVEDRFHRAFGDTFVRAAITGGEFYVIIEIVHSDSNVQKSMAASLQAEYNAFFASASVDFSVSTEVRQKMSSAQTRIVQYQAAGSGVTCSLVDDVAGALTRLKAFPQIALDDPVAIQVELAPYDTIPDLQSNPIARANLKDWLDDCASKRLKYKQVIDELEFFLTGDNKQYFLDPPTDEEAQRIKTVYEDVKIKVQKHAEYLSEGSVALGFVEPDGLPIIRLKRNPPAPEVVNVVVPDLKGSSLDAARATLASLGLVSQPKSRAVPKSDLVTPRMQVLSQSPAPQTSQPKNSIVQLNYAVTESLRFLALKENTRLRLVQTVKFAT